jgi:hypothetical protein
MHHRRGRPGLCSERNIFVLGRSKAATTEASSFARARALSDATRIFRIGHTKLRAASNRAWAWAGRETSAHKRGEAALTPCTRLAVLRSIRAMTSWREAIAGFLISTLGMRVADGEKN